MAWNSAYLPSIAEEKFAVHLFLLVVTSLLEEKFAGF
jgi:hypothetical protein